MNSPMTAMPPPPPPPPPPKLRTPRHQLDPGGMNPSGIELITGADPDGIDPPIHSSTRESGVLVDSDEVETQENLPTPVQIPRTISSSRRRRSIGSHKSAASPKASEIAGNGGSMPPTPVRRNTAHKTPSAASHNFHTDSGSVGTGSSDPDPIVSLLVGCPPPPPKTPPPKRSPTKRRRAHRIVSKNSTFDASTISSWTRSTTSPSQDQSETDEGTASVSTMTLSMGASKSVSSYDYHDAMLEERMRARRGVTVGMASSDPPTGIAQTGRISEFPTPRIHHQNHIPTLPKQSPQHSSNESIDTNTVDEPKSPVKTITVTTSPPKRPSLKHVSTPTHEESTKPSPLSPKAPENNIWKPPEQRAKSPINISQPPPKTESNEETILNVPSSSVALLKPSVEINHDAENFHPHHSPAARKSQAQVKKYRAKTPERLRRRNNKNSITTGRKKGGKADDLKETKETQLAEKAEHSSNKKGFFRKLFGKKGKSRDHGKVKSSNHSSDLSASATEQEYDMHTVATDLQSNHTSKTSPSKFGTQSAPGRANNFIDVEKRFQQEKQDQSIYNSNVVFEKPSVVNKNIDGFRQNDVAGALPVMGHDRDQDLYFAHDDVSTLTNPTLGSSSYHYFAGSKDFHRHSKDSGSGSVASNSINSTSRMHRRQRKEDPSVQSERSSDPVGTYWDSSMGVKKEGDRNSGSPSIDPFQEPFFEGDTSNLTPSSKKIPRSPSPRSLDGISGDSPKKGKTDLTVAVNHDPVGESPMHSQRSKVRKAVTPTSAKNSLATSPVKDPSPHGYQTSSFGQFNDPVGESPLHKSERGPNELRDGSMFAPDPPLYLQNLEDSSDEERESNAVMSDAESSVEEKKDDGIRLNLPAKRNTGMRIPRSPAPGQIKSVGSETPKAKNTMRNQQAFFGDDASLSSAVSSKGGSIKETITSAAFFRRDRLQSFNHPDPCINQIAHAEKDGESDHDDGSSISTLGRSEKMCESDTDTDFERTGPIDTDEAVAAMNFNKNVILDTAAEINSSTKPANINSSAENNNKAECEDGVENNSSNTSVCSNETSAMKKAKKALNMSAAARMNAKALAYIHTLNGDPSPRHLWNQPQYSDDESSPAHALALNKGSDPDETPKRGSARIILNRKPRMRRHSSSSADSQEYQRELRSPTNTSLTTDTKIYTAVRGGSEFVVEVDNERELPPAFPKNAEKDCSRLFSAYNPKFKGRKPTILSRKMHVSSPRMETDFSFVTGIQKHGILDSPRPKLKKNLSLTTSAFLKGVDILRQNREYDIFIGADQRVVPVKKLKVPRVHSFFEDPEPKDPIQRAGRRLLSKAAVPIQSAARRFLAQREAVDRMWATLEIQSYMRRWKAEAALLAYSYSATMVQKAYRGHRIRRAITIRSDSAVKIQKIVRGYLVSAMTYDLVYKIILVQAQGRGFLQRTKLKSEACLKIQTWWRCHSTQLQYKYVVYDAIFIQCCIRQWQAKRRVATLRVLRNNYAATQIQKVWRGYQGSTDYKYLIYDAIFIQCIIRQWHAKRRAADLRVKRSHHAATQIQRVWRGHLGSASCKYAVYATTIIQSFFRQLRAKDQVANLIIARKSFAATQIQKVWRGYQGFTDYIFSMADIITCQRIARGWIARKEKRILAREASAVKIQTHWRAYVATKDYIFSLIYILMIQRTVRSWLAKREVMGLRFASSATTIQHAFRIYKARSVFFVRKGHVTCLQCAFRCFLARKDLRRRRLTAAAVVIQKEWRCYAAQMSVLHDLVHIIMVQSLARRFLASLVANRKRKEAVDRAATKIQTAWRGFWDFSHYVILQYELIRMQALARGKLIRNEYNLQLGCCIMIQAAARRFRSKKAVAARKVERIMDRARSYQMREKVSAERIEFWWRVVLDCRKEKKAALVIERFFIMIKREIEEEVRRQEERRSARNKIRQERKRRESEDKLLENVFDNTVDDTLVDLYTLSPTKQSKSTPRSQQFSPSINSFRSARSEKRGFVHRASSPTMNLVMRHDYDAIPADNVHLKEETSLVSGLTNLTSYTRYNKRDLISPREHEEIDENMSLEEAFLAAEMEQDKQTKEKKSAAEKYLKMYGLQSRTAPNRKSRVHHFFADDLESTTSSIQRPTSNLRRATSETPAGGDARGKGLREGHDPFADVVIGLASPVTQEGRAPSRERKHVKTSGKIESRTTPKGNKHSKSNLKSESPRRVSAARDAVASPAGSRRPSKNPAETHTPSRRHIKSNSPGGNILSPQRREKVHFLDHPHSKADAEPEYIGEEYGMI